MGEWDRNGDLELEFRQNLAPKPHTLNSPFSHTYFGETGANLSLNWPFFPLKWKKPQDTLFFTWVNLRAEGLRTVLCSQWLRGHAGLDAAVLSKHVVPRSNSVYCFGWWAGEVAGVYLNVKLWRKESQTCCKSVQVLVARQTLQEKMRKGETNQDILHFCKQTSCIKETALHPHVFLKWVLCKTLLFD